jgi:putative oxidoreductase
LSEKEKTMNTTAMLPVARLMLGWIFVPSGLSKVFDLDTTATYISTTTGLPMSELVGFGTGVFEVAMGAALIAGYQARVAAGALALFCIATAVLFHGGKGAVTGLSAEAVMLLSELHFYMVFKNIAMAGGLLMVVVHGAGGFSADKWRASRAHKATVPS